MARLAIAIAETARLGFGDADLPIDARTGEAVLRARRSPLLLYRAEPAFNVFIATARVTAIEFDGAGAPRLCRLGQLEPFRLPLVSDREAALPRRQRHLLLADARFAELLEEAGGTQPMAAEESAGAFELDRLEISQRIYAEVMRRWHYTCPFTGAVFEPVKGPHPQLGIVAIRPREAGGELHVDNYLPMARPVAEAWMDGRLTLGPDLAIWVDKHRIGRGLEELLIPTGRLLPPMPGSGQPDPANIAFHRQYVFGAR